MYVAGLTDVGVVRNQNEDAIFFSNEPIGPLPNLYIVADGMGGHNAGEVASQHTIEVVSDYFRNYQESIQEDNYLDLMVSAVQEANSSVFAKSEANPSMSGMGTTITACVISHGKIFIAHVGDSRSYTIAPNRITRITTDHTYVEELVLMGEITAEEARTHARKNVLNRALGTQPLCEVDGIVEELLDTSAILLCSDGLSNMLEDNALMNIVNSMGYVEQRVKMLIDEANYRGGHDNISAILIDVSR